ncbi:TIGR03773 family transporter-associated surface protein [Microbacterium sp. NPDC096154]|uniref:TIGR03773 family transporter-associated surface protein n=1 Tax=Microbacterium sp. NPDC096154 TaxID=3155549 RepID=UPI0033231080
MSVVSRPSLRSASRRRFLALVGAACVLLSSVTGLAAAHATENRLVLDKQHTDALSVRYDDGSLVLKTRADLDSGSGQVLDPQSVLFHVTDALKDTAPDLPEFSFLGEPGTPIWKIPQTYQPGVLWAGWETESLPRGEFTGEVVRIALQDVTGPGRVELYVNDVEGPRRVLSSTETSLRTITENVGAHTHANWVFTAAGTYVFTFVAEADRVGGGVARSQPQTYTFQVGTADASPSPAPTSSWSATPVPTPGATETPTPSPTASSPTTPTPSAPAPSPSVPAPSAPADRDPIAIDPTIAPSEALPASDPASLTEGSRGDVRLSAESVAPGGQITVTVPTAHASHWVSAWLLSTPTDLGWKQVNDAGTFAVAVPPDAELGSHRLVVRDRTGSLVGWSELQVVAAPAAAAAQCVAAPAATTTVETGSVDVVTSGHYDFGPVADGSGLRALVKDDRTSPAQWVDPSTLVFHLTDDASAQAPGGAFDFLGSGTVWQIPLTQQQGVPWLGWNTQHPSIAGNAAGPVTLTLDGLEGPGELAVYSVDSWGQMGERYFGTVSGFPRSTSIEVGASGVHVHGIWAFTQPGAYYADLTFAGTIGGQRVSATSTLTFFVGPGDASSAARQQTVTTQAAPTADGADCAPSLAQTGFADSNLADDLMSVAGIAMLVGLALLGASALAPRRPERRVV